MAKRRAYCEKPGTFLAIGLGVVAAGACAQSSEAPRDAWDVLDKPLSESLNKKFGASKGRPPRWKSVASHPRRNRVWQYADAIGRLIVEKPGGLEFCTAFLVGTDKILTSRHCIMDRGRLARRAKVVFGYYRPGDRRSREFGVDPMPLVEDRQLDFVLLKVLGSPGVNRKILQLADYLPLRNTAALIVHHPDGNPMKASSNGCKINVMRKATRNRIKHTCDTFPGSSGTPVVAESGHVVAVHFRGTRTFGQASAGFAKPAYLILPRILAHLDRSRTGNSSLSQRERSRGNNSPTPKPPGVVILNREPAEGTLASETVVYVRKRCPHGNLMKITGGSNMGGSGQGVSGTQRNQVCVLGTSNW